MKTLAPGLLLSTALLVGSVCAAAAHHYDAPQYPMPVPAYGSGPTYSFYGPTANYFGAPPDDQGPPVGYGPPAYYGEAPPHYDWRQLPPQQDYDDSRLDPGNGYNGYRGLGNGY